MQPAAMHATGQKLDGRGSASKGVWGNRFPTILHVTRSEGSHRLPSLSGQGHLLATSSSQDILASGWASWRYSARFRGGKSRCVMSRLLLNTLESAGFQLTGSLRHPFTASTGFYTAPCKIPTAIRKATQVPPFEQIP